MTIASQRNGHEASHGLISGWFRRGGKGGNLKLQDWSLGNGKEWRGLRILKGCSAVLENSGGGGATSWLGGTVRNSHKHFT